MLNYFRKKREKKLYQQWVERASLSPDAVPRQEEDEDMMPQVSSGQKSRLNLLYILLGVATIILSVGIISLILDRC